MSNDGPDYKPTPNMGMPAQPATKELPAMTDRALLEDLARTTKQGFGEVRLLRGDVDLLVGDMASLKVDVRELQKWKIASEERQERHSGGARQLTEAVRENSSVDLKQDADIARIIAEQAEAKRRDEAIQAEQAATKLRDEATQAALAKNTKLTQDGLDLAKRAAKNPVVLALILAVATYVTAWLGHHTP